MYFASIVDKDMEFHMLIHAARLLPTVGDKNLLRKLQSVMLNLWVTKLIK